MKRSSKNSCALPRWPISKMSSLAKTNRCGSARRLLQRRNLNCPNTRTFLCNCRGRRFPSPRSMLQSSAYAIKNLQGGKKFWLHLAPENFLPKFCEQLVGQKPGETRALTVDFATDFPVKELAGTQASYNVTVREIKQKVLPALDDALAAKLIPGKTLADLRHIIEHDLEHEKEHERERAKEGQ